MFSTQIEQLPWLIRGRFNLRVEGVLKQKPKTPISGRFDFDK
jgi:hypothetical protein